jgi:hypothetical protein
VSEPPTGLSNAPTEVPPATPEEPPPVLGSWRNIYAFLVVELLVTAAVLYALTRWLS